MFEYYIVKAFHSKVVNECDYRITDVVKLTNSKTLADKWNAERKNCSSVCKCTIPLNGKSSKVIKQEIVNRIKKAYGVRSKPVEIYTNWKNEE